MTVQKLHALVKRGSRSRTKLIPQTSARNAARPIRRTDHTGPFIGSRSSNGHGTRRGIAQGGRAMTVARLVSRRPLWAELASLQDTEPADLTDEQLITLILSPVARCAGAQLDPDEWFPVANAAEHARAEASGALALCAVCPVRAECLEFAMRRWRDTGEHGIWGGLVEAERASARRRWLAGVPVKALLKSPLNRPHTGYSGRRKSRVSRDRVEAAANCQAQT